MEQCPRHPLLCFSMCRRLQVPPHYNTQYGVLLLSVPSCHVIRSSIYKGEDASMCVLSVARKQLPPPTDPRRQRATFTSGTMAASLVRGAARELAWLPSLQCVRHRSKAVTRHNRATHFERQKILALTKYIAPKPAVSESCVKPKVQKDDEVKDTLLEKFLCSQLENIIQENKMLVVFQRNAIGSDDFLHLKHRLHKHEIFIKVFPLQVIRKILDRSHLQELLPLFYGETFLVVSPHTRVKEMLQAIRTAPQIQLLGACIENRLLSKQGLVNYSKLPSKELVQGQLAGTLTMLTAQTSNLLTHHSAQLCAMLEQHGKEEGKEAKDN